MDRATIWALPEEEREVFYYSSFLKAISSRDIVEQDNLKEEYKIVYAEMVEGNRRESENNPGRFAKLYADRNCCAAHCYTAGSFSVFWMEKRLEYNNV